MEIWQHWNSGHVNDNNLNLKSNFVKKHRIRVKTRMVQCCVDLTDDFASLVASLESKPDLELPARDIKRILRKKPPKDSFESRARDVSSVIGNLLHFLNSNRQVYLSDEMAAMAKTETGAPSCRDAQVARDRIDAGANSHIQSCNSLIKRLRQEVRDSAQSLGETRSKHLDAVCAILEGALRAACRAYAELQAVRVDREVRLQKLSRLEFKARRDSESGETLEERQRLLAQRLDEENEDVETEISTDDENENLLEVEKEDLTSKSDDPANSHTHASNNTYHPHLEEAESKEDSLALSPAERKLFEQENDRLYGDLINVQDEVQQVETKVVRIAELQEIFTEKVLQQSEEVENISRNAVTATENVKDGNEEIRKAIQNQASIRVYVLFFLLVMSFSLLFLDWYND